MTTPGDDMPDPQPPTDPPAETYPVPDEFDKLGPRAEISRAELKASERILDARGASLWPFDREPELGEVYKLEHGTLEVVQLTSRAARIDDMTIHVVRCVRALYVAWRGASAIGREDWYMLPAKEVPRRRIDGVAMHRRHL